MSEFDEQTSTEAVLGKIAATGYDRDSQGDWVEVRNMIETKMLSVLQESYQNKGFVGPLSQSFDSRCSDLLALLRKLGNPYHALKGLVKKSHILIHLFIDFAPFTTQRLCELLVAHGAQYSATHKLMNALEKLLYVTLS